jgi:hypothetical protein
MFIKQCRCYVRQRYHFEKLCLCVVSETGEEGKKQQPIIMPSSLTGG